MPDAPLKTAYYTAMARDFVTADPDAVYGVLGRHHAHTQELEQKAAWLEQIRLLQAGLAKTPDAWLALEMSIPRMGKRADAIASWMASSLSWSSRSMPMSSRPRPSSRPRTMRWI